MNPRRGIFAKWQPVYSEHGIATFPVVVKDGKKKPAVRGYLKLGPDVSQQLVERFSQSEALGFALGPRNKIAILDVDTPDERFLADALVRHGHTPIIVRSGSGNFQVWYQDNGERRRIRPWGPDCPIDVLGEGGYVVAPPSKGAKGNYGFVQGSLDDVGRLPFMQGLDGAFYTRSATATELTPDNISADTIIGEGRRNNSLYQHCMRQAPDCDDFESLLDVARTCNGEFLPPLPDDEVVKTARSVWRYEKDGKNWLGRGRRIIFRHEDIDGLMMENPDAFVLLTTLRRYHWGRPFVVANGMAKRMPPQGWTVRRLAKARTTLECKGYIVKLRGHSHYAPAQYGWPFGKTGQN
jgi:hypothetical protein